MKFRMLGFFTMGGCSCHRPCPLRLQWWCYTRLLRAIGHRVGVLKMLEGFGHEWWIQGLSIVYMWGFPKIRVLFLGVPIARIILFGSLYWGPPILGNYHVVFDGANCRRTWRRSKAGVHFSHSKCQAARKKIIPGMMIST